MKKEHNGTPLKLYADGNGGIYLDRQEVLNDPEIQRKAEEFSAYLRKMARRETAAKATESSRGLRSDSLTYCNWDLHSHDG